MNHGDSTDITIVSPMWNESEGAAAFLAALVEQVVEVDGTVEILIVDDGSTDSTPEILAEWESKITNMRVLTLSRNFGHQAAITAGIFAARGQAVIVMDSDLQDPPSLIPKMIQKWREGADVVYAVRNSRSGETAFKKMSASLFYKVLGKLSSTSIPADTGDFRLMGRNVVEALRTMPERDRYMRGLVSWVGFNQVPVYFDRAERFKGDTKYSLSKMIRLGTSGIVGFSDKPLYLAISFGLSALGLAFLGLVFVISSLIFGWGDLVRGWASVVVIVMFFSAVQLIFLGVIGIYISRIFMEAKQRPMFIVKKDSYTKN
jgi:glycosyltransferase involved in cell wall biosynthesis